jgi:hypothetical protein
METTTTIYVCVKLSIIMYFMHSNKQIDSNHLTFYRQKVQFQRGSNIRHSQIFVF